MADDVSEQASGIAIVAQVHAYVDETVRELADGSRKVGVGALVVAEQIASDLIERAMGSLQSDPDRDPESARFDATIEKLDRETLRRGYFHASEDSMNAHSPLAREIKTGVRGRFLWSFSDADTKSDEAEFRRHAIGQIVSTLETHAPVNLVFEERSGFSRASAQALVDHVYDGLDWCAYQIPMMRSCYPRVEVTVKPKMEPGLQVVDLLLWAATQAKFASAQPKARIAGWCGLRQWAEAGVDGETERWIKCDLNGDDPLLDASDAEWVAPYPVEFALLDDGIDDSVLANLYALAERVVRGHARGPLPAHAEHLRPGLQHALSLLANASRVGPDDIRELARQFLRLFDMVPIYRDLDADSELWPQLLRAKKFLGLTLRRDLLHGVRTADFFANMRRDNIALAPHLFGLGP